MKKYLSILITLLSLTGFAQQDKGDWLIGVSTSNIGFNSNNGSETILDVNYTEFETLPDAVQAYHLNELFPYNYNTLEDKSSLIDININVGYFLADNFTLGIMGGFSNETSVFKSSPLSDEVLNLSPEVIGNSLGQYPYNEELYYEIAYTADNDITSKSFMWSVAPFARYYHKLGFGSIFINASYSIGKGDSEIKTQKIANTKIDHTKISSGIGYSIALGRVINLEPIISYEILTEKSTSTREVVNPYDVDDMGVETRVLTRKSTGIVFSIGISSYL